MIPLTTVIITSHREEDLTLHSLPSVLRQTIGLEYIEILVTFSKDRFDTKMRGSADRARGKYILFLSDDDELEPTFLEKTVFAAEQEKADIVYTDVFVFGKYNAYVKSEKFHLDSITKTVASPLPPTFLIRREYYESMGGYDHNPKIQHDYDFILRSIKNKKTKHVHYHEPLFLYQIRSNSSTPNDVFDGLIEMFAKHNDLAKQFDVLSMKGHPFHKPELTAELIKALKERGAI